jgi:copper(I)-binding protein
MDPLMKPLKAVSMLLLSSALVVALVVTVSCGNEADDTDAEREAIATVGELEIVEAYVHALMMGGAAYFTIENTGDTDDALIGAVCNAARRVDLHETVTDGRMMKMQPVEEIAVPAGGEAIMEPGGYHVMLIDLKQEYEVGDTLDMTLTFKEAGAIDLAVEVTPFG